MNALDPRRMVQRLSNAVGLLRLMMALGRLAIVLASLFGFVVEI